MATKDFKSVSSTNVLLDENPAVSNYIQPIAEKHLQAWILQFEKKFPANKDPRNSFLWVVDAFLNVNEPNSLDVAEKNELIGSTNNVSLSINCILHSHGLIHFDINRTYIGSNEKEPVCDHRFGHILADSSNRI